MEYFKNIGHFIRYCKKLKDINKAEEEGLEKLYQVADSGDEEARILLKRFTFFISKKQEEKKEEIALLLKYFSNPLESSTTKMIQMTSDYTNYLDIIKKKYRNRKDKTDFLNSKLELKKISRNFAISRNYNLIFNYESKNYYLHDKEICFYSFIEDIEYLDKIINLAKDTQRIQRAEKYREEEIFHMEKIIFKMLDSENYINITPSKLFDKLIKYVKLSQIPKAEREKNKEEFKKNYSYKIPLMSKIGYHKLQEVLTLDELNMPFIRKILFDNN